MAIVTALDGGRFDGIEYEEWKAQVANDHLSNTPHRVHPGRIEDIFPRLASEHGPVDLVYVDALHTYDDMLTYKSLVERHAAPSAVVVYDDIDFSLETGRFWRHAVESADSAALDGRWGVVRLPA